MAIDSAAKRRNVGRLLSPVLFIGLTPSGTIYTAQRVNTGRAYIGLTYSAIVATPENIALSTPITNNVDLSTPITININLSTVVVG
jgi:hypothetical protein